MTGDLLIPIISLNSYISKAWATQEAVSFILRDNERGRFFGKDIYQIFFDKI